ncbi:glutamate--cysteine ligase [Thermophagus sp. OGC60D27]|uniref:glutamate--cysteine ligase n=1 Tax=Thermophagus sp. OGC60D27 TaxID=3458415 RepID=UPI004038067B
MDLHTEITSKKQLIDYFEEGNKPPEQWGIGTEHEKFLFDKQSFRRIGYDTTPGIRQVLRHIEQSGWKPLTEQGNIIGLTKNGASITIEPGGQFELSGKNFRNIHQTYCETQKHFDDLSPICRELDVLHVAMGFDPISSRANIHWMPKERYRIMRAYMPTKGELGHDMMTRTATIQVNLDYGSEKDMVCKMRIAQALQPIVTAIFANSPFCQGKPNGYLSYRAHIWDHTDPDRCGFLPFLFDEDFGFEKWVDYLLDIPMYFIIRDGQYLDCKNITFRSFMAGEHRLRPTLEDWENHVSTVFPDVRLKRYIEMRGADASCVSHIAALSAFWVGLLYDQDAIEETYSIIRKWNLSTLQELRSLVPKNGLKATSNDLNAKEIARRMLDISAGGLSRRSKQFGIDDEGQYLWPIQKITETGITQAEEYLHKYHTEWQGDITKLMHCIPQEETSR